MELDDIYLSYQSDSEAHSLGRATRRASSILDSLSWDSGEKNRTSTSDILSMLIQGDSSVYPTTTVKKFTLPSSDSIAAPIDVKAKEVILTVPFVAEEKRSLNPFIGKAIAIRKEVLQESLLPDLSSLQASRTSSLFSGIVAEGARKQLEAQSIFRGFQEPRGSITKPAVQLVKTASTSSLNLPPPPLQPPYSIPKRQLGRSKTFGNDVSSAAQLEEAANDKAFEERRQRSVDERSTRGNNKVDRDRVARLNSMGIFDVDPKSRSVIVTDLETISLNTFETPYHEKPLWKGEIREITGPQLVSTSSKIHTVPIVDIHRDLKAAGRLIVMEDEPTKPKKKSYF